MFTKAELTLIEELREQNAPIERWAKFFPNAAVRDLLKANKKSFFEGLVPSPQSTYVVGSGNLGFYCGKPITDDEDFRNIVTLDLLDPEAFAERMKKGNIYRWDKLQDEYLTYHFQDGWTTKTLIKGIERKFGITRTEGAIDSRLSSLGLI